MSHYAPLVVLQLLIQLMLGWRTLSNMLSKDPAFGAAASTERGEGVAGREVASQPTMSRLLGMLSAKHNLSILKAALTKVSFEHIFSRVGRKTEMFMDVDAMPLDAHGKQSGSEYNGHYKRTVFLPLFASCVETGDVLTVDLRQGNKHEVTDCEDFVVSTSQKVCTHLADTVIVRMSAGFNSGALRKRLEAEGISYLIRPQANRCLDGAVC